MKRSAAPWTWLAPAALAGALAAVVAAGSCSGGKDDGKEKAASGDAKGGDGGDGGDEDVILPVPIYLAAPKYGLAEAETSINAHANPTASAALPSDESAQAATRDAELLVGAGDGIVKKASDSLRDVNAAMKVLIEDYFGDAKPEVAAGESRLYAVTGSTFPAGVKFTYARVSVLKRKTDPIYRYQIQAFCPDGDAFIECVRYRFVEDGDRAKAKVLTRWLDGDAFWLIDLVLENGKTTLGIVERRPTLSKFGGTTAFQLFTSGTRSVLQFLMIAASDGTPPTLFPSLPRSRFAPSEWKKGDAYAQRAMRNAEGVESVRERAFVPAQQQSEDALPTTIFASNPIGKYAEATVVEILRTKTLHPTCDAFGTKIGVTADVCAAADASLSDAKLIDALDKTCMPGTKVETTLMLKGKILTAPVAFDVCEYFNGEIAPLRNPQYLVTESGKDRIISPPAKPSAGHLAIEAALKAEKTALSRQGVTAFQATELEKADASAFAGAAKQP